jgi:putative phosphoesterase
MFIGLLSDTHGRFDKEFRDFLSPVDEIWHAGDFGGGLVTAAEIADFKPLKGVSGNCDDRILIYDYPEYRFWECEGLKVLMMHIGGSPGHYNPRARSLIMQYEPDIFVCGHSHILKVMRDSNFGFIYINPGAAGIQGWQTVRTALRFHIDSGQLHDLEVFNLPK